MTITMDANTANDAAPRPGAPVASLRGLARHFRRKSGEVVTAIDDVTLDVAPGEFLILLGPSGCGKTTLLRSIAGLEQPDSGQIELRGKTVFDSAARVALPPEQRDLGMIFQSYALWPHMTVFGNVAYPLQNRRPRVKKTEIRDKVERVLSLLGIENLAEQHPSQLSGGQQQRVALARALVAGNDLILFDEPLSNVDAKVREHLRIELKAMQTELGFSAIYVTHDQAEAMELADRIAVVQNGRVAQVGTPREIYDEPVSQYVANFVGTSNQLIGKLVELGADGVGVVEAPFGRFHGQAFGVNVGDEVVGVVRPSRAQLTSKEPSTPNRWHVHVQNGMFLGSNVEVVVKLGDEFVRVWRAENEVPERGAEGWLSFPTDAVRILPRESF